MTLDTFFEKFELFADCPNAVEKMRELVMHSAVVGKLSHLMPGDDSAGDLVHHLGVRKAQQTGTARQSTVKPAAEGPCKIPAHWVFLSLGDIGQLGGGMTPSKNRSDFWEGDVNWFSPKDIKNLTVSDSEEKITRKAVKATGLQVYPPGCLLMVARSGILKRTFPVAVNRAEATVNQDLKVLIPFLPEMERYLQIMFRGMTPFILSALVKTGTTVQSLRYEEFETQPFPVPPVSEQKRIVAKVEELMALLDRLEAQQKERETRRTALARASLARFADAPTPANLNLLFHKSFSVNPSELRKTLLHLAVRGKLVPRQRSEGTGQSVLERFSLREQPERSCSFVEPLPNHWAIETFSELARIRSGVTKGRKLEGRQTATFPYLRVANVQRGYLELESLTLKTRSI